MTDYDEMDDKQETPADRFAGVIRDIVHETISQMEITERPYANTFSTLTIRFAEGSEPGAVSIPYRPFQNREDIYLPYRLVKADES